MTGLRLVPADDTDARIALAKSLLGHAAGHEQRAIAEALAALNGAGIVDLLAGRNQDAGADGAR